jgi:hypothetical protein
MLAATIAGSYTGAADPSGQRAEATGLSIVIMSAATLNSSLSGASVQGGGRLARSDLVLHVPPGVRGNALVWAPR